MVFLRALSRAQQQTAQLRLFSIAQTASVGFAPAGRAVKQVRLLAACGNSPSTSPLTAKPAVHQHI